MTFPDVVLEEHYGGGVVVAREDLIPGGTKARALPVLFDNQSEEYVYASPVYGYAQIAIAHAAKQNHKRALIFCAARRAKHPRTLEAYRQGANIFQVPCGYMSVVSARAREYCQRNRNAKLLPFGLDHPDFVREVANVARSVPYKPPEVWCAAGSGVLARALQEAFPGVPVNAVRVGAETKVGGAKLFLAPERFEDDAKQPPPFPSCSNYDAKVWRFIKMQAKPGALFWNL